MKQWRKMRNTAGRGLGKYFMSEADARRVNRIPTRSFNKPRSAVEGLMGKRRRRMSIDDVPKGKGETQYEKQNYNRGGGKRKRRKTQRKPRKTRRTKRRSRRTRR